MTCLPIREEKNANIAFGNLKTLKYKYQITN